MLAKGANKLEANKFAICDDCCEKVMLYSKVHHYKYNSHSECKNMVSCGGGR